MTRDLRADHLPPYEPWKDRALTAEELAALKVRLSKMSERELVKFYDA